MSRKKKSARAATPPSDEMDEAELDQVAGGGIVVEELTSMPTATTSSNISRTQHDLAKSIIQNLRA